MPFWIPKTPCISDWLFAKNCANGMCFLLATAPSYSEKDVEGVFFFFFFRKGTMFWINSHKQPNVHECLLSLLELQPGSFFSTLQRSRAPLLQGLHVVISRQEGTICLEGLLSDWMKLQIGNAWCPEHPTSVKFTSTIGKSSFRGFRCFSETPRAGSDTGSLPVFLLWSGSFVWGDKTWCRMEGCRNYVQCKPGRRLLIHRSWNSNHPVLSPSLAHGNCLMQGWWLWLSQYLSSRCWPMYHLSMSLRSVHRGFSMKDYQYYGKTRYCLELSDWEDSATPWVRHRTVILFCRYFKTKGHK